MIKLSRISGLGMLCVVAAMLTYVPHAYAQSQSFLWEPEDPPRQRFADIGTGVAVSGRMAAVGASVYEFYEDPDYSTPAWVGLVNVYEANAERTQWTLLTVLHANDGSPVNALFGKAIAMEGRHLVVASNAALRVYERRHRNYVLVDTVVLSDATISESAPIQLVRDVLAIGVLDNDGGSSVRVFHIGPRGKARAVSRLSYPLDADRNEVSALSLDADARALAVGVAGRSSAIGHVYLYEPRCNAWRRTATFAAPDPGARGFGSSVALRGKRLLVGAPGKDEEFDFENNAVLWSGAVYAYRLRNHRWVQVQRLATNVPAQPSYASVQFGWEIVTNGRHVWITAPFAHDQSDSSIQAGRPALYRWNAGQLEYVIDGPDSYAEGAIDMSRRYVIESDLFNFGLQSTEGAHNVDLRTLVPTDTDADEETADVDRQE